jgi:hypothetical protein
VGLTAQLLSSLPRALIIITTKGRSTSYRICPRLSTLLNRQLRLLICGGTNSAAGPAKESWLNRLYGESDVMHYLDGQTSSRVLQLSNHALVYDHHN